MRLNTTEKGNILEERLHDCLKRLLDADDFWTNKKFSTLYRHKGYFSSRRGSYIITDISVEVCPIKGEKYTQLFIFECKNYESTVPISDIEEFATKLAQISNHGFNVKGVLVGTSNFTKPGIELAKSYGIALIRMAEDDSFEYSATRTVPAFPSKIELNFFLTENSINRYLVCTDQELFFYDLNSLFLYFLEGKLTTIPDKKKNIIPFLSDEELRVTSEDILWQYSPKVFEIIQPTPLEHICASLRLKEDITFCFDKELGYKMNQEVLGKLDFKSSTIYISSKLEENSYRWRFTLAHEIGHLILHKSLFAGKREIMDTSLTINGYCKDKCEERMEIQANKFAVNLLIPALPFEVLVRQRFYFDNVKNNVLCVDNQSVNLSELRIITEEISKYFQISKLSARYRLKEFGYLIESNQPKRVRDYLA